MKTTTTKRLTGILTSLLLFSSTMFGTTYTTTGSAAWTSNTNWSPSKPPESPQSSDTIIINHAVTLSKDVDNKGVITINSGGTLTGNGKTIVNKSNGKINVSGTLVIKNLENTSSSGTINLDGNIHVTNNLINTGTISNDGFLAVDGSVTNSSTITGTGNLCNSDGVTTPTGAKSTKGIDCPICTGDVGFLPVEIVEFNAKYESNQILLNWFTASEIDNDYFEIMTSNNGIDFSSVATMNGFGNSNSLKEYAWKTENFGNSTVYFQLRQVDFSGKSTFSKIVSVQVTSNSDLKVYPNPVKSGENLTIEIENESPNVVEFYNASGKLIKKQYSESNSLSISTEGLISGLYIIKVIQNDEVTTSRIFVQ